MRLAVSLFFTFLTSVTFGDLSPESLTTPHKQGEMIVTFQNDVPQREIDRVIAEINGTIVHKFKSNNSIQVRLNSNDSRQLLSVNRFLASNSQVKKIALNRLFSISTNPDDPKFSKQYHHRKIESSKAWEITTGDRDIVVAIIDTGVLYNHPDLKENYWTNPGETGLDKEGNDKRTNGIDDDKNGYIDDFRGWDFADNDNDPKDGHGHGTHCAGTIGAKGDNGVGITGINWDVSIVGLRFLNNKGQGSEADAIKAIEYATMMGFDVTSNSWGGDASDSAEEDLLKEAIKSSGKAGLLFIAAAGNNGRNTDKRKTLPAGYDLDTIISVGSSDSNDRLSGFSNYGTNTVDLLAPGSSIYSTKKSGFFSGEYGSMSGTSMAAPMVAGAVALIKSEFPSETALEIKQRILDSVDQISSAKSKSRTGGRLNLFKALSM